MSRARRTVTAWITVAALLFSALSPAMAGVLFSDRPDILARVLALPVMPAAGAQTDIYHPDRAGVVPQAHPDHPSDEDSGHAAHGIFCSFCLASASVLTLPTVAGADAMVAIPAVVYLPAGHVRPPAANPAATRHPRDPPPALR